MVKPIVVRGFSTINCPSCGVEISLVAQRGKNVFGMTGGKKLKKLLLSHLLKNVGPKKCWIWTRGQNGGGYGVVTLMGVATLVHRVVYELCKGKIKRGMVVLHSCDNTLCARPSHLKAGTQGENIADSVKKGRWRSSPK